MKSRVIGKKLRIAKKSDAFYIYYNNGCIGHFFLPKDNNGVADIDSIFIICYHLMDRYNDAEAKKAVKAIRENFQKKIKK